MKYRCPIAMILLVAITLFSLAATIVLFNQARRYYVDLNETRLDPLGLNNNLHDPTNPTDAAVNVLFYGDSRAANWPFPEANGAFAFLNRGIGAQTTTQAWLRFAYHVAPLKPETMLLQVGVNDLKTIPLFPDRKQAIIAACQENIGQIVSAANALGTTVILSTIFPVGDVPLERRPFWSDDVKQAVDEVNEYIRALAGEQVIIFDAYSLLTGEDGLLQARYSQDELHLNAVGYDVLNLALYPILESLTV
ncbi:MAG: SGNH/GDSL hydrolase family protein [Anaerolineae bacterium]|nr:SGNH/GDSL hydrolase family protein [Anaerolineae bacterium]